MRVCTYLCSYSGRGSFRWICPEARHLVVDEDSWMQVKLLLLMNETEPPSIQPAFLVSLVVEPQMHEKGLMLGNADFGTGVICKQNKRPVLSASSERLTSCTI